MGFRFTALNTTYVPDVMLPMDDGTLKNNRELPSTQRISVELKLADGEQRSIYSATYSVFDKESSQLQHHDKINVYGVIEKHVEKVFGLENYGIITGIDLAKGMRTNKEFSDIAVKCYNVIIGIMPADYDESSYKDTVPVDEETKLVKE